MNLFELFESPVINGANNLKAIATAATTGGSAEIMLGNEPVTLEYPEARFVYGLYKRALQNGQQENFLQVLTDPRGFDRLMSQMRGMLYKDRSGEMAQAAAQRIGQPGVAEAVGVNPAQNTDTMQHIINRFKHEVKNFVNGDELDTDLYHALFDYYSDHGEIPYGVSKARDGDPFEWVTQRFDRDVNDYVTEGVDRNEVNSLVEGWKEMMADVKARAEREKKEKGTGKFDKKTTSTGTVYTRKYNQSTGEVEDTGKDGSGEEKEKRGRGRPRTRPEPDATAPKRGRGRPRKNPAPDANAPKRGRGRPKKVREWIETLRYVAEGYKKNTGSL
jgi:hypothetical protein